MTIDRESVIKWAREAGLVEWLPNSTFSDGVWWIEAHEPGQELEAFAALVASHVRETEFKPDWNNYNQGRKDGAEEEREACAKLAEVSLWPGHIIAKKIRERSNTQ